MDTYGLAERNAETAGGTLRTIRSVATPPGIIKAGGEIVFDVRGASLHRIRSDFPAIVLFDGSPVSPEGLVPAGIWHTVRRDARFLIVRLAAGYGAAGATEAYARHGALVCESVSGDQLLPEPVDPRLLPPHCYEFAQTIGDAAVGVVGISQVESNWHINGKLPTEIYVTGVSWLRRIASTLSPAGAGSAALLTLLKTNTPAGDQKVLLSANAAGSSTLPPNGGGMAFDHHKLPLASLFQQYAAETPVLNWQVHVDTVAGTTLVWYVTCTVRW